MKGTHTPRASRARATAWTRRGLLCLLVGVASAAVAQVNGPVPKEADGAGLEEHVGSMLPLDAAFADDTGRAVQLGDYFATGRPVLLTLNYYSCPMLCTLQLNGLVAALRDLDWNPGVEFELVTVSINPRETPALASAKKENYVREYERPEAAAGWHFLTGADPEITALASAVGFEYEYDPVTKEYAHPAVAYVVTPDGKVSRYLYGVQFDAQTIRYSLVEASEGRAGTPLDRILLFCFHYDATRGRYAPAAKNLMRAGGLFTMLVLGAWVLLLWSRESRTAQTAGVRS